MNDPRTLITWTDPLSHLITYPCSPLLCAGTFVIPTLSLLLVWSPQLPIPLLDAFSGICLFSWSAQTSLTLFSHCLFLVAAIPTSNLTVSHLVCGPRHHLPHSLCCSNRSKYTIFAIC